IRRISTYNNSTFTTANNERRYTVYASTSGTTGEPLKPDDIGISIKAQLERGAYSNDWKDHAGDTYSQYSQLQDAINLRVKEGDLLSQINIEADRILIDTTGRLVLNAQSTLISNAVIKNAHIESLSGQKIISKSIIADKLDVASLDAITADLGTVTSGLLKSQNNNMELNLNTGSLTMQRAEFTLGGGTTIQFTSSGNTIHYKRYDDNDGFNRSSGFGVGNAFNNRFPVAFMGTTGSGNLTMRDDEYFTGFIANTNKRMATDRQGNAIVGDITQIRNNAINYNQGWEYNLQGSRKEFRPINAGTYNYDLGTESNMWDREIG